ncbi:MAG: hypothetical protein ACE5GS_06705 [Kiloniellaceae bacterium]
MGQGQTLPPGAAEFEIRGADGAEQHAANGHVAMTLYPDGPSRMRKRNAIKHACTPRARRIQWLYAELDGVRCYVNDDGGMVHIVLTKRDLYP